MAKVYCLNADGTTESLRSIHCVNEDKELQRILELNPDLLPGEQINPDEPRRWLLIKREMPVPDPGTGGTRWSIDLFFADQDAMPTFVECKRFNDTRAKREVVGQMLDYAANGHHYWTKGEMRSFAKEAADRRGVPLEEEILGLQAEGDNSVDTYFQRLQDNLREGQVRLVFFMEDSSPELRSIVDFLNKQMERSEVLLVEARQYEREDMKIVVPVLFGYTEEARLVKRTVTVNTGQRRKWDEDSFVADAREQLDESEIKAVRSVLEKATDLRAEITWGTGKTMGSFNVKFPQIARHSVFSVFSNGQITVNYGGFAQDPDHAQFVSFLKDAVSREAGLEAPEEYENRFPSYSISTWMPGIDGLIRVLEKICEAYPALGE